MQEVDSLNDILCAIVNQLSENFRDNLKCVILYGSWAKGTARKDSDIDLLVIFEKLNTDIRKQLYEIKKEFDRDQNIEIVSTTLEDFKKEKIPLYTAIKREGKILLGKVDMSINPEEPMTKYREFFERSKEFETKKIEMAERIHKDHPSYGTAELCFVASKHAIQMALAMKGEGYSSKVSVLLPLAERHFGKHISDAFRKLFQLYVKSEYEVEFLTEEESGLAIELARRVLEVYNLIATKI